MSCGVAIKRPLDLSQDSFELSDVKRPRHSGISPQCSLFRPQLNILATSLSQTLTTTTTPLNFNGAKVFEIPIYIFLISIFIEFNR